MIWIIEDHTVKNLALVTQAGDIDVAGRLQAIFAA
jgi:hypothetical protein